MPFNNKPQLLTPQQLERTQSALRLCETKMRDLESSLQRIRSQQQWLRRWQEKSHELSEHQNRLYQTNKRLATIANDEKDLLRFETFETVQGLFQRMTLLEKLSRENKMTQSIVARELEEKQRLADEQQKRMAQLADDYQENDKQMSIVRDQLEEANRILGARSILDLNERSTAQLFESVRQQKNQLVQETKELETQIRELQDNISRLNIERQSLEPHQQLMIHGEMAIILLERLQELKTETAEHKTNQDETIRKQQEANNMLSRVFSEYQSVESDIKTLNAELQLHRQQNLGRTSYSLQERAMQLKSRRQMLISAQSLWNRIQAGYLLIEEKTQRINNLRLNIENLKRDIDNLENKVIPKRQLCHDKEYTLTLSKSQNVIQLRGDLKEGVSCTVCGATHHPYHSDTMLEQSKLISDLRIDFEILRSELNSQEKQLKELQLQYVAEQAHRDVEEEELSRLRQRQIADVKEWGVFSSLDRTFAECSSSTNMEARTTMLRQLIENTSYDADDAQKELDEYNFHQTRINEITEELTRKELRKNDLALRLNEVNTGCQVLAQQLERVRDTKAKVGEQYTALYEKLNTIITLNDWYNDWQRNHEGLRLRIEKMMERWVTLNNDIQQLGRQHEIAQTALEEKKRFCAYLDALNLQIREDDEKRKTIRKDGDKTYENLLGKEDVQQYFNIHYQHLLQTKQAYSEQQSETIKTQIQLAELQGRKEELTQLGNKTATDAVAERSQLDIWMRQFNATHPPVQYSELERAFATDRDWNALRESVRSVRIENMLEQTRVDSLRSAIVALQAEGMSPANADSDNAMESLVAQEKQLEKQRQDMLMQWAEYRLALKEHEENKERLRAEEEELYAQTNNP